MSASSLRRVLTPLLLTLVLTSPRARAEELPSTMPQVSIPHKEEMQVPIVRIVGLLGVLGALIGGCIYIQRRMGGRWVGLGSKRMRLSETLRLGPRTALYLVEIDGMPVLVGLSGQTLQLLPAPIQAATHTESTGHAPTT